MTRSSRCQNIEVLRAGVEKAASSVPPRAIKGAPQPLSKNGSSLSSSRARIAAWHCIRWSLWLPLIAFALYGLMLARYSAAYAGGVDSSGYLNDARLLDHGNLIAPMRQVPGMNAASLPRDLRSRVLSPRADHVNMAPIYPMGLPLLIMAVAHSVGWNLAPTVTAVLHALFGLWLVYLLGREAGLEPGWAWIGTMVLQRARYSS